VGKSTPSGSGSTQPPELLVTDGSEPEFTLANWGDPESSADTLRGETRLRHTTVEASSVTSVRFAL
jgi:hypothetical protein